MSLDPRQRQTAQLIYGIGISQGLSPERARELVAASFAESGLRPNATNKSSGAAGLFQLLSSGYRTKAESLGGLYNPRANTLAILPDYQSYWKRNPNAPAGYAARDVERSGMGADFYDDVGQFAWLTGGAGAPGSPGVPAAPGMITSPSPQPNVDARRQFAMQLIQSSRARSAGQTPNIAGLMQSVQAMRQPPTPAVGPGPTGPSTSFPAQTPAGGDSPATMLAMIREAQRRGLRVGENPYTDTVDPVHVTDSMHYQTFPGKYGGRQLGRAADITGTPEQMAAYFNWVRQYDPRIAELIYDPLGSVFDGTYSSKPYGGHRTHVHIGV